MADGDLDDPGDDGNDVWNIERVLHAERVGRWYKLWIKWRGSNEISPRWRHELVKETTNAELLQEIKDAVDAARSAARHEHGGLAGLDPRTAVAMARRQWRGTGRRMRAI